MFEWKTSCCFTGHRRLPPEQLQMIQGRIRSYIDALYQAGIRDFYAGGALGFDMLAAISVLNAQIDYPDLALHLALPCRDHDAKWPQTQRQLLARLIDRSDSVIYASETYSPACMHIRNRYMVDHSLYCLCYLDEQKSKKGGTASTVRYALSKNRIVYNLCPDGMSILRT